MGPHCARLQGGVSLGLYRKGMVLSSSLETVGFDTLPQTGNTAEKGLFWASWITSWKVYCSPGKEKDMWGEPGDTKHQALELAAADGGCFGVVRQSLAIALGQDST